MMRISTRIAGFAMVAGLLACSDELPTSPIKTLSSIDVQVGTGPEAVAGKRITVHYTGWLYSETAHSNKGARFDSSVDRGAPFTFVLGVGGVIEGWDRGVAGMRVGGRRTLIIPPELAYGREGRGSIPPNAALLFEIELLSVQ